MEEVDPEHVLQPAAVRVRDPLSGRSVWLAGLIADLRFEGETLAFTLQLTPDHDPNDADPMIEALVANLRGQGFHGPVAPKVAMPRAARAAPSHPADAVPGMSGPGLAPHGGPIVKGPLPGVKRIIAVASGKGGVGKSTIASNLAVGLRVEGYAVGLVDADIHGPSVPVMMNVTARPGVTDEGLAVPPSAYGVRCLSMGMLVDPNEAMIWRGPMVMGVLRQFLQQTVWGELDVLVVDMPPGTGDAQLTLIQAVDLDGAVIVTTPQEVALADAIRGIEMFRRLHVPLLGLVENMAWYERPDGQRDYVFGRDGGVRTAEAHGIDLLTQLPLRTAIRKGGDAGLPAVLGSDATAASLRQLARDVAARLKLERGA